MPTFRRRKPGASSKEATALAVAKYTVIGTVAAALIGALATVIVAYTQRGASAAESAAEPVALEPLLWSPAKCGGSSAPEVAIGKCSERRSLHWLSGELQTMRKVPGFARLRNPVVLHPSDRGSNANYRLTAQTDVGTIWDVTVGYVVETNSDDGCVRLYDNGKAASSPVCLRADQKWCEKTGGSCVLID